ncbi:MAG: peptidyl-dipeptidase A [Arenicella sp.]|jgi:peptidyl-dipeptidase A
MKILNWLFLFSGFFLACTSPQQGENTELVMNVNSFILEYETKFVDKFRNYQLQNWEKQTGKYDSLQFSVAQKEYHSFLGKQKWASKATEFLIWKSELLPIQVKQLHQITYSAIPYQETVFGNRLKINSINNSDFRKSDYIKFNRSYFSFESFDSLFRNSGVESVKKIWWQKNRESLKGKTNELRILQKARNQIAETAGYGNYFTYLSAEYGMSAQEVLQLNLDFLLEIRPIFRELHTFVRHELAEKYRKVIPAKIPNYWLNSFSGTDWSMKANEKYNQFLKDTIEQNSLTWLQKQVQQNFEQLDFPPIPAKNMSYETEKAQILFADIDRQNDLRLNKTLRKNLNSYKKFAQETMKWHYAENFINPDVPILLREPACSALEIGFAKFAENYNRNVFEENYKSRLDSSELADYEMERMLEEALEVLPQMVYQAGVVSQFEFKLYANELDFEQYNYKWWELKEKFLGTSYPEIISSEFADMAVEESIFKQPFQSFHDFFGTIIAYDLEKKMEKEYSHLAFQRIMRFGKVFTWQEIYEENLESLPSSKIVAKHFKPLVAYLKKKNAKRKSTLPEWE